MIKPNLLALMIVLLSGCASKALSEERQAPVAAPILQDWSSFSGYVNELDTAELKIEQGLALKLHGEHPNNESRLRLAYLLSRPRLTAPDIRKSQALLAEIDSNSKLSPLRDLITNELRLLSELHTTRQKVNELQDQVRELETNAASLQMQLDALKEIETDLNVNENALEELPE